MTLRAGTITDFSGSLAEAMESALGTELLQAKGVTLPASGQTERRALFCAIAQGILQYLKDNEDELTVTVDGTSLEGHLDFSWQAGTLP